MMGIRYIWFILLWNTGLQALQIEDRTWLATVKSGDGLVFADRGQSFWTLEHSAKRYLISPISETIEPSMGGYKLSGNSPSFSVGLRPNWNVDAEIIYEIALTSERSGEFSASIPSLGLYQTGTLDLIGDYARDDLSIATSKVEYLLLIPAEIGNTNRATKLVWEESGGKSYACFDMIEVNFEQISVSHHDAGSAGFDIKPAYFSMSLNGLTHGGQSFVLEFNSDKSGIYHYIHSGPNHTKHYGIFLYTNDLRSFSMLPNLGNAFQNTPCEEPYPEWDPSNDKIVSYHLGNQSGNNPKSISVRFSHTRGTTYVFQSSSNLLKWHNLHEFTGLSNIGEIQERTLTTTVTSNPFYLRITKKQ